ncbi:MAG: hypothetical protein PUC47_08390 [Oscillospiraceae bacterium]|nr:hypothetical protein [Oscillospiraceae bacterium]
MKKQVLCLLLCCVMVLGLLPMTAFAEDPTPVTNIAVTVDQPVVGETPDFIPAFTAEPANSVRLDLGNEDGYCFWFKIAEGDYTGTDEDDWILMDEDDEFEEGYYYSVDVYFNPKENYAFTSETAATLNDKSHDTTFGPVYEDSYVYEDSGLTYAYVSGVFGPLVDGRVSSEEELRAALDAGVTEITLTADFQLKNAIVLNDKEITLDLNGHYIVSSDYSRYTDVFVLEDTGASGKTSLTLIDSRPEAGHWTDTLPKGGLIRGKITVTVKDGGKDCQLIANGGSVTGLVGLQSTYASIRCTNGTPTAFYNDAINYGKVYGGIFYGDTEVLGIQEPTITFMDNGTLYAREVVESGSTAVPPLDPAAPGSEKCLGWYADGESTPYDFSAPVTGDITLTAKWFDDHTTEYVPAEAPLPTVPGNFEYWVCETCGKWFEDEACEKVIKNRSSVIDKGVTVELPFAVVVKQGGNITPEAQTFELEFFDPNSSDDAVSGEYADVICTAKVETDGEGRYRGKVSVFGSDKTVGSFLHHGFLIREKDTGADYWLYSDAVYQFDLNDDDTESFWLMKLESSENGEYYVKAEDTPSPVMTFENIYTLNISFGNGHIHTYSLKYNPTDHWYECEGCGKVKDQEAHIYGEWTVTKEPTETEKGEKEHTCTVCEYSETEEIPATGSAAEPSEPADPAGPAGSTESSGPAESADGDPDAVVSEPPKTGSDVGPALWTVLLLAVGFGVTGAILYGKKRTR